MFKTLFNSILFLFLPLSVFSQVRFQATASPTVVGVGQYITYRIVIENAKQVGQMSLPSFKGLTVVSGPSQESGMSSINGNVTQYVGISYILQPVKTGSLQIPPVTAEINGQRMQTAAVNIEVKAGNVPPPSPGYGPQGSGVMPFSNPEPGQEYSDYILHKGETVQKKVMENMALRLETNKTTCYVGEPIIANYVLYSRLRSESRLTKNPAFNGFSVVDMTDGDLINEGVGRLNGKDYNTYVIRKAQLYPLQPGDFVLESASLENDIEFLEEIPPGNGAEMNDIFQSLRGGRPIREKVTLNSPTQMVHVKPLPEAGKPASFKGAVGKFAATAEMPLRQFSTDDMAKLVININGEGNLHLVNAPEIRWPKNAESFDPKITESLNKMVAPISGNKSFEYTFNVTQPGEYILDEQEFSFFDPATESYHRIKTSPIKFEVTQGRGRLGDSDKANTGGNNIWQWVADHKYLSVSAGVLFLLMIMLLIGRRPKPKPVNVSTQVNQATEERVIKENIINQENPFPESKKCIFNEDCKTFYSLLNQEFTSYLYHRINNALPPPDHIPLSKLLDKAGLSNSLSLEIQDFLNELRFRLYTPGAEGSTSETYSQAMNLVHRVNEELKRIQ